jgi:putative NIF3 family GTP cyclohydrolase 1 type 2
MKHSAICPLLLFVFGVSVVLSCQVQRRPNSAAQTPAESNNGPIPSNHNGRYQMTVRQVVERIHRYSGEGEWSKETLDTFKAGDPDVPITGIVTTFTPTMAVLRKAVADNCNLIITHEPTFYNHTDDAKGFGSDPVYLAKIAFIQEHHLVVWRFHDHWHQLSGGRDGILEGMITALHWRQHQDVSDSRVFSVRSESLDAVASEIASRLRMRSVRVVGDRHMKVVRIALLPGAVGPELQLHTLERKDVDVLVVGETREWETVEYVRDAVLQGRRKALIVLGHDRSEEDGMKQCELWLKGFHFRDPYQIHSSR